MAMRTVGGSVDASPRRRRRRRGSTRPVRPQQHHAEREARDRHRDPGPPEHRAGAVGQRGADGPGQLGPEPEGEDGPDHEQADRQHVGPVPGELAPGGVTPPGQRSRLGGRRPWSWPRWSSGPPACGPASSSSGPTRDHAASWSRASPKANTPTTTHTSISPGTTAYPKGANRPKDETDRYLWGSG